MHVVALVVPVCSSLPRCVMCLKVLSWCCVTLWWATWITPWCTTWSGDSLSSNCTSYTTCWRYSLTTPAHVPGLVSAAHPSPPPRCVVRWQTACSPLSARTYWTLCTGPPMNQRRRKEHTLAWFLTFSWLCYTSVSLLGNYWTDWLVLILITSC